jgi:hypothetical protein
MIHLQSNQRLYISEDLRGYVDKLIDDGTIPYAVDFLQLGFAYAVREEMEPATDFDRHTITTNTDILGDSKLVMEATAQWHARESGWKEIENSDDLLRFICATGIKGARKLRGKWKKRSKSQIQKSISSLAI